MNSIEIIQAHISFLEQNMKHDSILKPSLINDDMLEIEAYKKVLKDLEEKELLEIELKVEKDKVKYIMGQLEKQDKILKILKEHFANDIVSDAARYRFLGKIDFEDEHLIGEWLNNE